MKSTKINKRIDPNRLPKHIAFIMDGNGRWALRHGLKFRWMGHQQGYVKMIEAVKRCTQIGIPFVSIYGFSTENWGRPKEELDEVFRIVRDNMKKDSDELLRLGIKLVFMGDETRFPKDLQDELHKCVEKTKNNTKCVCNLCISYGGRADIIQAVKKIKDIKAVTEESFSKLLESKDLPDPDFVVRTSGEQRLSNFMLWQMAYSELYFPKRLWPAIDAKFVDKCIIVYQKRNRRFGC